jgi:hypothetical protein
MTVVRIDETLDPDHRQGVLDALREQADVTAVTAGADAFDIDLAGYDRDAANARAAELLRTVLEATGTDPSGLAVAPHPEAHPGGAGT